MATNDQLLLLALVEDLVMIRLNVHLFRFLTHSRRFWFFMVNL